VDGAARRAPSVALVRYDRSRVDGAASPRHRAPRKRRTAAR